MREQLMATGPYAMPELIMPGGTSMPTLLYLARRTLAFVAAHKLS
jgi:hypothetical protein